MDKVQPDKPFTPWTPSDFVALSELRGARSSLLQRIAALKWAVDLVREAGDSALSDTLDDILTETKHVARRRHETAEQRYLIIPRFTDEKGRDVTPDWIKAQPEWQEFWGEKP